MGKSSSLVLHDGAYFPWVEGKGEWRSVDVGVNLADSCFDTDRAAVVQRARTEGVMGLVVTGTSIAQSQKALELVEEMQEVWGGDSGLWFTAGVHPHDASTLEEEGQVGIEALKGMLNHERCVAVGECGLDFNRNLSPPAVQERWFEEQVKLAIAAEKPLFLHCREAVDSLARILGKYAPLPVRAVAHCFTGDVTEVRQFLNLGLYIGLTGWICDERDGRSEQMAEVIREVPLDKLMIETDSPYLAPRTIKPSKIRPRRNEPCLLPHVLNTVAEVKGMPQNVVAAALLENSQRFFRIRIP